MSLVRSKGSGFEYDRKREKLKPLERASGLALPRKVHKLSFPENSFSKRLRTPFLKLRKMLRSQMYNSNVKGMLAKY